ncbi:hypothetical protein MSG28_007030, partial [Choristoneura fumiferana]
AGKSPKGVHESHPRKDASARRLQRARSDPHLSKQAHAHRPTEETKEPASNNKPRRWYSLDSLRHTSQHEERDSASESRSPSPAPSSGVESSSIKDSPLQIDLASDGGNISANQTLNGNTEIHVPFNLVAGWCLEAEALPPTHRAGKLLALRLLCESTQAQAQGPGAPSSCNNRLHLAHLHLYQRALHHGRGGGALLRRVRSDGARVPAAGRAAGVPAPARARHVSTADADGKIIKWICACLAQLASSSSRDSVKPLAGSLLLCLAEFAVRCGPSYLMQEKEGDQTLLLIIFKICTQLVLFLGHWPLWSSCQLSCSVGEQHDSAPPLGAELGAAVLGAPHLQLLRLSDATLASLVLAYIGHTSPEVVCGRRLDAAGPSPLPPGAEDELESVPASPFASCSLLLAQLGTLAPARRAHAQLLRRSERLLRELRNLDAQRCRETHKVAVIYVGKGQETRNEILSNRCGSPAYEAFLAALAWEVELESHVGFLGGLRVGGGGATAPYVATLTLEALFHHWRAYKRDTLPTQFCDVLIALYPLPAGLLRCTLTRKPSVAVFGPLWEECLVPVECAAALVRGAAWAGGRAVRATMPLYQHAYCERARSLQAVVAHHTHPSTFETTKHDSSGSGVTGPWRGHVGRRNADGFPAAQQAPRALQAARRRAARARSRRRARLRPRPRPAPQPESVPASPFASCSLLLAQLGTLAPARRAHAQLLRRSERLLRELRNLDAQRCRETHKVAVIYVGKGQETRNEILSNRCGSPAYEAFLAALAWEVELESHVGFLGGLRVGGGGATAPYVATLTLEALFHECLVPVECAAALVRGAAWAGGRAVRATMPLYQHAYCERARSLQAVVAHHTHPSTFETTKHDSSGSGVTGPWRGHVGRRNADGFPAPQQAPRALKRPAPSRPRPLPPPRPPPPRPAPPRAATVQQQNILKMPKNIDVKTDTRLCIEITKFCVVFFMRRLFSTMANLPPRKISPSSKPSKQDTSPLQILLQMGFPKHRALKALAATGNRSVQLASDWLLTHVNDGLIDADEPREYILYANPTGAMLTQLHEFWEKSKKLGWNGAHHFPPHITLVSFFKAPDETSLQLGKIVKNVVETVGDPPACPIKLDPYISQNFMGLFVSEEHAEYLKKIAVQYVKQVHKVTQGYSPIASDELELVLGDYIYIEEKAFDSSPDGWVHGTSWLTGVSGYLPAVYTRRTAESDAWTLHRAISLGNNNSSDCKSESDSNTDGEMTSYPHEDATQLGHEKSEEVYEEWARYWQAVMVENRTDGIINITQGSHGTGDAVSTLTTVINEVTSTQGSGEVTTTHQSVEATTLGSEASHGCGEPTTQGSGSVKSSDRRWIFAMRHGERVDLTYGVWVPFCFDECGRYAALVGEGLRLARARVAHVYASAALRCVETAHHLLEGTWGGDTRAGRLQAALVGEGLRLARARVAHVYASAALRCVETAHHLLEGTWGGDTRGAAAGGAGGRGAAAGARARRARVRLRRAALRRDRAPPAGGYVGGDTRGAAAGGAGGRGAATGARARRARVRLRRAALRRDRAPPAGGYVGGGDTRGAAAGGAGGRGLRLARARVAHVYASAALRCVETAHHLLEGGAGGRGLRLARARVAHVYASAALRCVETAHHLLEGTWGGTRAGRLQAALVGEGLRLARARVAHVYASAALRCVETAHHLLEGTWGGTRAGRLQAALVGEGLRLARARVAHVYASAALRCVETAHHLLEGTWGGGDTRGAAAGGAGGRGAAAGARARRARAALVGEGLRLARARVAHVYASAALRCVETAHHLLEGTWGGGTRAGRLQAALVGEGLRLARARVAHAALVGEGLRLARARVAHVYASAALRCVETAHHLLEGTWGGDTRGAAAGGAGGRGLRLARARVAHVYASAALRCVETAHHLLEGLQDPSLKVKVDPGLFEYKNWYAAKGMAPFMTPHELHKAGYNVDLEYKPYVTLDTNTSETMEEFYKRNEFVMHSAIKDTEAEGGNIIFVGHAATLDMMVVAVNRLANPHSDHPPYQLSKHLLRVPYCALGAMRDRPWQVVSPPCPPSINSSSGRFDWRLLLDL